MSSSDDDEPQKGGQPPTAGVDDDDSDIFSDDEDLEYMLGFVVEEPVEANEVLRHKFPSKLGGRPAWLDPVNLPSKEQLTCRASGKQLNFLLQLYAPLDDQKAHDAAFHRSMFIFVTPNGKDIAKPGAVRAFRCQLPRATPFYGFEPPTDADRVPKALPAEDTKKSLASDPWKTLSYEASLAAGSAPAAAAVASGITLYPERELEVEPEERETEEENEQMKKLLKDYQEKVEAEGELSEDELPPEVLNQVQENLTHDRRHFAMFQARVACAPEQCIRYCFLDGAGPLWPSPTNLPGPTDIPPCPRCGKPRKFEFQIMPQLLNHLAQDELDPASLDWSTVVVYSCEDSCAAAPAPGQPKNAYAEEFVWVQPAT